MEFKILLKEARKKSNISLQELEKQSGVSKSAISYYEHGGQPTLEKANTLLASLGVSMVIGDSKECDSNGRESEK